MFSEYAKIEGGNDNVRGFVCLDVDASYGFRSKYSVWNKDDNCDRKQRDGFVSKVNYAILTLSEGWRMVRDTPIFEVSNESNDNFNKVKTFDELKQMLADHGIMNAIDNPDIKQLMDSSFSIVCQRLKEILDEHGLAGLLFEKLSGNWDEFVYINYVNEFNKSYPEFRRLIDLKKAEIMKYRYDKPEITVQRKCMDWFVCLFNNVPYDVIVKGLGATTKYSNERPFEIFCQAINEKIKTSRISELENAWAYYNEDVEQPVIGGGICSHYKLLLIVVLGVLAVVLIVVVFLINDDSEAFCSKCEEIKRLAEQSPEGVYW